MDRELSGSLYGGSSRSEAGRGSRPLPLTLQEVATMLARYTPARARALSPEVLIVQALCDLIRVLETHPLLTGRSAPTDQRSLDDTRRRSAL